MLALVFVTPARAFESRNGENIIIGKEEVIDDDLYTNAATVVVDGTVVYKQWSGQPMVRQVDRIDASYRQ